MRGSVMSYRGGWAVRYDGPGGDELGRRRQHFKSGFATRKEAETYLAQRLAEVATGRHVAPTRWTFAAYARHWLETAVPGSVRASSAERYASMVHTRLIPAFGSRRLDAILPGHVTAQARRWEAEGLAPRTIRELHGRLRQILAAAVDEDLLAANSMDRVKAPRVQEREMRTWSAEELTTFLDRCPALPLGALWRLYAMTGCRRGEALGLRWRDLDRAGGRLTITRQVVWTDGAARFGPPKTTLGRRTISLDAATIALLDAHRAGQLAERTERLRRGDPWHEQDLIFAYVPLRRRGEQTPGGPWRPDVITNKWRDLAARADLPAIRLHDLRHTHATLLLRADGNVKAIAMRLGHDPVMLLRTYAHACLDDQTVGLRRLEALLASAHSGAAHAAR